MVVFKQMLVFLMMILLGIVAGKCKIITKENQSQFSSMVINIACPCLIVSSVLNATERISTEELKLVLGIFTLLVILVLLISKITPIVLHYEKKDRNIVNVMGWCTNITFIGLPLVQNLYGSQAVIYVTFAIMIINILFYSYGVILVGSNGQMHRSFCFKNLMNPGIIACVTACAIYFLDIKLPDCLVLSLTMVGNLTAPLAMMMIGVGILEIQLKDVITDVKMIVFILIKMILVPVLALFIIKQFTDHVYLLAACMAIVASPTGGMVAMLATLYNPDAYNMVTREISFSTLISVVTIPIVAIVTGIQ